MPQYGRTLTGAWIETYVVDDNMQERNVAPSRVRGLKLCYDGDAAGTIGRTLTGAWIETWSLNK